MMGKMAGKRDGNAGQEQGEQEYGYIQALLTVFVAGKGVGESKDVETLMLWMLSNTLLEHMAAGMWSCPHDCLL